MESFGLHDFQEESISRDESRLERKWADVHTKLIAFLSEAVFSELPEDLATFASGLAARGWIDSSCSDQLNSEIHVLRSQQHGLYCFAFVSHCNFISDSSRVLVGGVVSYPSANQLEAAAAPWP